jgi:hypothetical protein
MRTLPAVPLLLRSVWNLHLEKVIFFILASAVVLLRLYLFYKQHIQFFDESYYLAATHGFIKYGALPPWSWNPGVIVLNALWYFPIRDTPFGLETAGRVGMLLTGIGTYIGLALALFQLIPNRRWIAVGIGLALIAAPLRMDTLNSSDTYYTLFLLLIFLALMYASRHPANDKRWLWAAVIIGMSTTIRNDATIVAGVATFFYGWHLWRARLSLVRKAFIGGTMWLLPIMFPLLLYSGWSIWQGGVYIPFNDGVQRGIEFGISGRTYLAFEQGEGYARRFQLEQEGKTWWGDGRLVARELYGTSEENGSSVLRAIARNPMAWLNRLQWNLRDFFIAWQEAYSNYALPVFLVGIWGWGLLFREHPRTALIFLILFLPTVAYFTISYWSPRYVASYTPLWILLATYALYRVSISAAPLPRRWSIGITLVVGISMALFWYVIGKYTATLDMRTMLTAILLYLLFAWRFVFGTTVAPRPLWILSIVGVLALGIGTYSSVSPPNRVASTMQLDMQSYLLKVSPYYQNQRTCINGSDLNALSLVWYGRQVPVSLSNDIVEEAQNGTLQETMLTMGCEAALVLGTNDEYTTILTHVPSARILYRGVWNHIFLFEVTNQE